MCDEYITVVTNNCALTDFRGSSTGRERGRAWADLCLSNAESRLLALLDSKAGAHRPSAPSGVRVPLPACSQTSEAQQPAVPASVQDPSETAETPAAEEASEGPEAPKAVDLVEMFGNFRAMNIFRR